MRAAHKIASHCICNNTLKSNDIDEMVENVLKAHKSVKMQTKLHNIYLL